MQRRFFSSEPSAPIADLLNSEAAFSQDESSFYMLPRPSIRPSLAGAPSSAMGLASVEKIIEQPVWHI